MCHHRGCLNPQTASVHFSSNHPIVNLPNPPIHLRVYKKSSTFVA